MTVLIHLAELLLSFVIAFQLPALFPEMSWYFTIGAGYCTWLSVLPRANISLAISKVRALIEVLVFWLLISVQVAVPVSVVVVGVPVSLIFVGLFIEVVPTAYSLSLIGANFLIILPCVGVILYF